MRALVSSVSVVPFFATTGSPLSSPPSNAWQRPAAFPIRSLGRRISDAAESSSPTSHQTKDAEESDQFASESDGTAGNVGVAGSFGRRGAAASGSAHMARSPGSLRAMKFFSS